MALPRSLASIIPMLPSGIGEAEIYLPLFDYCWPKGSTPQQQGKAEMRIAKSAEVLAQDLVNAAVYSLQVLVCVTGRSEAVTSGRQWWSPAHWRKPSSSLFAAPGMRSPWDSPSPLAARMGRPQTIACERC